MLSWFFSWKKQQKSQPFEMTFFILCAERNFILWKQQQIGSSFATCCLNINPGSTQFAATNSWKNINSKKSTRPNFRTLHKLQKSQLKIGTFFKKSYRIGRILKKVNSKKCQLRRVLKITLLDFFKKSTEL